MEKHVTLQGKYVLMLLKFHVIGSTMEIGEMKEKMFLEVEILLLLLDHKMMD